MVSGVNPSLTPNLLAADRVSPQSRSASDSFSQQLLTMIQSSLERLGVASADIRPLNQSGESPSQRQFVVTLQDQKAVDSALDLDETAPPEVLYEDHPGFSPRLFATEEMAGWLARRLGGEVGTFQWEWSPLVPQPPAGYTVRFGEKEINAGSLAMYFEPGRFVGSDQEAALALFRDGVVNDYVRQHRPELIEEFGLPV